MPETTMDQTVPVPLTESDLAARAETMAAKIHAVDRLRKKKAEKAKELQALIDIELDELKHLADDVEQCVEGRKQGDLFVSDQEASEALAKAGTAACTCESDDVATIDCPVHGTVSCGTKTPDGETDEAPPAA